MALGKYDSAPPRRRSGGRGIYILVGVIGGGLLLMLMVGCFALGGYNKAIRLDEEVKAKWAQVENQLKRRHDLIPNLINTVKGYASHETEIFDKITEARAAYGSAGSTGEKAKAAGQINLALSRLLAIAEDNPELKANENFLQLQDQLEGTENRIAVERKRYNEAVKFLNAYIRKFPSRIYAGWADVEAAAYFEVPKSEQEVPEVKF